MDQPTLNQAWFHHRPPMQHWRAAIGGGVLLVAALLAGCSPPSPDAPAAGPTVETAADLIAALEQATGEAVISGDAGPPHFGVSGQMLKMDGEMVEVYAFPDSAGRATAQSEIDPQGPSFLGQPLAGWRHPRIWGAGRLLVVYDGSQGGTFLVLSGLLGDPMPVTVTEPGPDEPYPPAISAAIGALAEAEAADPGQIGVLAYEAATWPDGCLGLRSPGATCAPGEVQGWRIELSLDGATIELRTDELGQRVEWRP